MDMDASIDKKLMLVLFWALSSVSFVSAGSFFAHAPVSFSLGFDEDSAAAVLVWSVLASELADLSVEGLGVDFVFG
jgi:hypothetical protein